MNQKKFTLRNCLEEYLPFVLLVLITLIVYVVLVQQPDKYPHTSMTFVLWLAGLVPPLFFTIFGIKFPVFLKCVYYVFIFLAIEVANVFNVFSLWPDWDTWLHGASGPVVLLFAYYLLLLTGVVKKGNINLPMLLVLLFFISVGFSLMWEIVEMATDVFVDSNSQHNIEEGVLDTMQDILINAIGTLISLLLVCFDNLFNKSRGLNGLSKLLLQYSPLKESFSN